MKPLLLSALLLIIAAPEGRAEGSDAVIVALGQWQVKNGKPLLAVPLADVLTPKQKSIITGGFTTVSQLTVDTAKPGQDDDDDVNGQIYSLRCTVKFDAWEETYDVARLDDAPKTATLKSFNAYGDMCLKADLTTLPAVVALAKEGGTLFANLVVKQTSLDEAARIKEWLIQQQSGVMQSLFSHMLGELTLSQSLKVRISVPPRPADAEQAGKPAAPAAPRERAKINKKG